MVAAAQTFLLLYSVSTLNCICNKSELYLYHWRTWGPNKVLRDECFNASESTVFSGLNALQKILLCMNKWTQEPKQSGPFGCLEN